MTGHSDLIAELGVWAADMRPHPASVLMKRAASALSSQSLSLSEALERCAGWAVSFAKKCEEHQEALREIERLREALGKVEHWAESRCPCHNEEPNPCPLCGASVENLEACKSAENTLPRDLLETIRSLSRRARSKALENGPAVLADAHSNPTDPSLSSLRKGAEVAPLEYVRPHGCEFLTKAETIIGEACVWTHHEANGAWFWKLGNIASGTEANEAEAKKMLWVTYDHRIRSALVSGSREDGDG